MTNTNHDQVAEAVDAEFGACHRELRAALGLNGRAMWPSLIAKVAEGPRNAVNLVIASHRRDLCEALGKEPSTKEWSALLEEVRDLDQLRRQASARVAKAKKGGAL